MRRTRRTRRRERRENNREDAEGAEEETGNAKEAKRKYSAAGRPQPRRDDICRQPGRVGTDNREVARIAGNGSHLTQSRRPPGSAPDAIG